MDSLAAPDLLALGKVVKNKLVMLRNSSAHAVCLLNFRIRRHHSNNYASNYSGRSNTENTLILLLYPHRMPIAATKIAFLGGEGQM